MSKTDETNDDQVDIDEQLPSEINITLERKEILRYGENPHQVGARYTVKGVSGGWWDAAVQHSGKALSYLNVYDADAAWRLAWSLGDDPTAVVIKHANPCGAAIANDIFKAYVRAHLCDDVSAFGGIVAFNRPLRTDEASAIADMKVFTEVMIAPGYDKGALKVFAERKPNMRVLEAAPPGPPPPRVLRSIDGGYLVQTPDPVATDRSAWRVVTKKKPTTRQYVDAEMAWPLVAKVTSNAIVLVKDRQAVGIGCGQQNRRDAGKLSCEKANGRAKGGVYASDAFFPFPDGLDGAVEAGATCVIQPGGSNNDQAVIDEADKHGLAMIFVGERHFRH